VHYDHLYIGGGKAQEAIRLDPAHVTIISNEAGIRGAIALWQRSR
jgi:polyphosphate glucokinase